MRYPSAFPRCAALVLVLSLLSTGRAQAQLQLVKSTVYGSGGTSQAGAFSMQTTTSQPDAGQAAGGNFALTGSFAKGDPAACAALVPATGLLASETFCPGVRVTWTDNSDHESGYRVYRNGSLIGTTGPNATSVVDSTAVPGVIYTYYVVTFDDCGQANASNSDTGHRPAPPVAPTGVAVRGIQDLGDSLQFHLTWTDNSPDEALQIVYLMNPSPLPVDSLPPNAQTATVTLAKRGQTTWCFAVSAEDCGTEARSDSSCASAATSVAEAPPKAFRLGPVLGTAGPPPIRVLYDVAESRVTTISIYDVTGRFVRSLHDGATPPGRYEAIWNGHDERGNTLSSGVYFLRMQAGGFRAMTRIVLLK